MATEDMNFAADRMLGRLVKWLRIIGEDVIYGPHLCGYGLIRAARAEGRLILTRDSRLNQKQPPAFLYIESDRYREQLCQVVRACGLSLAKTKYFSRCLECNSVLQPIPKDSVAAQVPAYVFASQEKFSACPTCRRVYWPATHHTKMLAEIERLHIG